MSAAAAPAQSRASATTLRFSDVEYFYRWSKDDQHEFTPRDQEDLKKWADMVTINFYRSVKDGDALAATANAVIETYKKNRAMVVRTNSILGTAEKPAEHFIVVLFPRPEFVEAVFARFRIADEVGLSVIYSHREYGNKIGDAMSAWLKKNGPAVEKALMRLDKLPALNEPRN